ncbi:MAG: hypothetical protein A3K65_06625 [Euryarchaeota archaeon RBG_16_68_12]|nr:MAG: hypothetical protein A3K65_06625 [Euryarchaeota archaeon RBG_16_68_12]
MPITKEEFQKGRKISPLEKGGEKFLSENAGRAYTVSEILRGVGYKTGINLVSDFVNVIGLEQVLKKLIADKKVAARQVDFETYYTWTG